MPVLILLTMKAVIEIINRREQQRLAIRLMGAALFATCLLVRPLTRYIHAAPSTTLDETTTLRMLRAVNMPTIMNNIVQEDISTRIQEVNDGSSIVVVFESDSTGEAPLHLIDQGDPKIEPGAISSGKYDDGEGQEATNLQ
jgi:hypothetical protein